MYWGFPGGSVIKNPPAVQETWVCSLDWEDPLEKEMATHFSILAWEIPCTEEPGGLQSKDLDMTEWVSTHTCVFYILLHLLLRFNYFLHHILANSFPSIVTIFNEKVKVKGAQSCPALWNPMDYTVCGILQARILEWVASFLLQGIFPTQGANPGLQHWRRILYQLSYQGSPFNERTIYNSVTETREIKKGW